MSQPVCHTSDRLSLESFHQYDEHYDAREFITDKLNETAENTIRHSNKQHTSIHELSEPTTPAKRLVELNVATESKRSRKMETVDTTKTITPSTVTSQEKTPSVDVSSPAHSSMSKNDDNKTTLWIGDLERWEDEDYIYHFFDQFCPKSVVSVKIARDREQQRSLGYGFIDFASREIAEQVLSSAPGLRRPHGRRFKLTWARGKTRQPFNPAVQRTASLSLDPLGSYRSTSSAAVSSGNVVPPVSFTPPPFVPGGPRWCIDIAKVPSFITNARLKEIVLRPLNIENTAIIEPFDTDSLRIIFTTSTGFFTFIGRYRDGQIDVNGHIMSYLVPPDVMDRWTRMYEQSLESPRVQSSQLHAPYSIMNQYPSIQTWNRRA